MKKCSCGEACGCMKDKCNCKETKCMPICKCRGVDKKTFSFLAIAFIFRTLILYDNSIIFEENDIISYTAWMSNVGKLVEGPNCKSQKLTANCTKLIKNK